MTCRVEKASQNGPPQHLISRINGNVTQLDPRGDSLEGVSAGCPDKLSSRLDVGQGHFEELAPLYVSWNVKLSNKILIFFHGLRPEVSTATLRHLPELLKFKM